MHLLEFAASTDPATSGNVLATLAGRSRPAASGDVLAALLGRSDPNLTTWLLAHPSTPPAVAHALGDTSRLWLPAALNAPLTTPTTRDLLLSHTATEALTLLEKRPDLQPVPGPLMHLIARLHGDDAPGRDTSNPQRDALLAARTLFNHPDVDIDNRWRALNLVLTQAPYRAYGATTIPELTTAALGHLAHLDELLTTIASTRHAAAGQQELRTALDAMATALQEAATHPDPVAAYINSVRARRRTGELTTEQALRAAPLPAYADELAQEHAGRDVLWGMASYVALRHARVYPAAAYTRRVFDTPPSDVPLPADLNVAIAQLARDEHTDAIATTSELSPTTPADTVRTIATATLRLVDQVHAAVPGHFARLLLHPALPADMRPVLLEHLEAFPGTTPAVDRVRPLLNGAPARDVLDLTVPAVSDALVREPYFGLYLAQHVRPLLRALPHDDARRVTLALEPTFTGTYRDLLAAATTISR